MTSQKEMSGKRVLFLSYWSADEPLVRSTILPYLVLMANDPRIVEVVLLTVERSGGSNISGLESLSGVRHVMVHTRFRGWDLLSKLDLFIRLPLLLIRMIRRWKIDVLDSKAALAGGVAYLVHRIIGIPYIVESFEPHSEYMADCGVWSRQGLYYKVSRFLELKQRHTARYLVTVTWNYYHYLISEGVPKERIKVIPSITDLERFAFDPSARESMRARSGWVDAVIGIYVGKFGGLYYDEDAFQVFRKAKDRFGPSFKLVILTMDPGVFVRRRLAEVGLPEEDVIVQYAPHQDVPNWLSMADLAFSTIRYAPNGLYQSPVKNGEYWANGLPVLLTHGVSDDHQIIQECPWSGALFDVSVAGSVERALDHMAQLVSAGIDRDRIMGLAREFRSIDIAKKVYTEIFSNVFEPDVKNGR
jgi:glycosyltransferase involved in cell wall biosynthesis